MIISPNFIMGLGIGAAGMGLALFLIDRNGLAAKWNLFCVSMGMMLVITGLLNGAHL